MNEYKITVVRRMLNKDFAEKYCENEESYCPVFIEGQEFILKKTGEQPQGFCPAAWNDIIRYVFTFMAHGNYSGWMKNRDMNIICCTNGIRPVVFKIEKM